MTRRSRSTKEAREAEWGKMNALMSRVPRMSDEQIKEAVSEALGFTYIPRPTEKREDFIIALAVWSARKIVEA